MANRPGYNDPSGYRPDLDTGKKRAERKSVLTKLIEMCEEQGVKPEDTLSVDDIKRWMRISHADKNMITLIAQGYPVRNAQSILRAIEMKMERDPETKRTQPAQGETVPITVTVNTITPEEAQTMVVAKPPVIHRKHDA